jgi:phenylalanyl-tRNA synthetase beta chain
MKVPLKWLRDYVDVVVSPEELAHRLTMAGLEADGITYIGANWQNVYVGQIRELRPHPNADRLQLVTADYGHGTITVVTGAFNMEVGDKVPVALVGARLIDGHSAEPRMITLQPTKLRGVVSEGMVCSGKELGLSADHAGILILHPEAVVGRGLQEELGDVVIDLALTPNRSDALAMIGVAREVAALTGQKASFPSFALPEEGPPVNDLAKITIQDPDLCPRYSAMVIQGIRIGPSPRWMQERLTAAGQRPINNIVDITNYVMLEYGQPLHAFDLHRVQDRHIIVRRAKEGEHLVTLDGVDRKLEPDMLVIADPERAVGLAGVMGGANTEVTEETTDILLESANFDATNNRRTARGLDLLSEASRRFEKGLPIELTVPALRRAVALMREQGGGVVARGVLDAYPNPVSPRRITLPNGEATRLLGLDLDVDRISSILSSLSFEVEQHEGFLLVTVPLHRVDVTLPADLVEEVARVIGYDAIPDKMLSGEIPPPVGNSVRAWEAVARETLVGCGLAETICYSLTSRARQRRLVPASYNGGPVLG